MARRRIRWPLLMAAFFLAAGAVLLAVRPQLLAPAATRLVNRQLLAHLDGHLRVGAYHVRFLDGVDLLDVTLTRRGRLGELTLVAIDTLQVDFRLREILGRTARLRGLAAYGVEVYHNAGRGIAAAQSERAPLALPHLEIGHLDLRGARVEVSGRDGRLRERIEGLHARAELELGGSRARLVLRGGGLAWPTRQARLDSLGGEFRLEGADLVVEEFSALWNDGEAVVSGRLGPAGLELAAVGRNVATDELNDLTGLDLDFGARGDIDCTVSARDDTVRFQGVFSGVLEAWELDGVRGEAVIAGGLADFSSLHGWVGGAWFDGTLLIDERGGDGAVITLAGRGYDLDLSAGLVPDVADLPQTGGSGRLEIVHRTADDVTLVRGLLTAGFIEFMPFDTCFVDVWARGDSLELRRVDLRRGGIRAELAGTSDRRDVFAGRLRLAIRDLADLPPAWGWPQLRGSAKGQATLRGRLDDLGLSGNLTIADFGLGPLRQQTGAATLTGERVLGEDWALGAAVTGDGFALGGVPLGDYGYRLRADAATVALDSFRTVLGDTALDLAGRADLGDRRAQVQVDRLHLAFGGNDWRTDGPVTATVGPGLWQLPRLSLTSSQGELSAAVDYRAADEVLAGRLKLTNINLDVLDAVIDWPLRTGGRVTARLDAGGRPAEPTLELQGVLRGATFPLAYVDSLAVTGGLFGGTVHLDTLVLASDHGRLAAAGTIAHRGADARSFWPGASLDLRLQIEDGDWGFLRQFELEALEGLAGRFDGRLHLTGTSADPVVVGDLDSAPFQFNWLRLQRLTGSIRADARQLALGDLRGRHGALELEGRLEIPLRFDLLSTPVTPEDGPFYGYLRLPPGSDLGPLMLATSAFARCAGRGEAELTVAGPLTRPQYQGRLAADNLEIVIRDTEEVFREGRLRGVFSGDQLILQEIRGRAGLRGTFSGAGTVTFEGLELRTWDIAFQADRFLVASIPELRALVRTRNGRLTGEAAGPDRRLVPRFTGDYELIRGRYVGNFGGQGGTQDPTLGTIAPDWLADLRITGPPRTMRIVNRTMELDLSGDISLVRDADGMVLNGTMDIDAGRLPVFNNTFRVVRGSLDFSREVGVVPRVDIDAETRVRLPSQVTGYSVVERLTVHATGPADAMTISYSSESGYPREAIERMLLGLSPYPDEQGDQGALTSASIGAGLNLLEREIAREIGIFDTFEIDQIQRQQVGLTGLEPLIGVGKYVGTDFYIKYAQGLNQNDRDLLIEYQITNNLLLQTEIRRRIDEYQGDATYNLDFKYRFEY